MPPRSGQGKGNQARFGVRAGTGPSLQVSKSITFPGRSQARSTLDLARKGPPGRPVRWPPVRFSARPLVQVPPVLESRPRAMPGPPSCYPPDYPGAIYGTLCDRNS